MSSEVKLIVQNKVKINPENAEFALNFATEHHQGRSSLFLSKDNEFLINSFNVNIDTGDVSNTD